VFGTLVDISIYGEEASRAADLTAVIQQDFQRLHHKLHAWNEDSDLSRLSSYRRNPTACSTRPSDN